MSRSKGDRPGFRHFKRCPSLNCDYCVNGKAKRPARRALRRAGRTEINRQILADLHPTSLKNAGSMTYGQDTAD